MAAIAGYPHMTVPMGAVKNLPVGVSFMSGAGKDERVMSIGYAYEQASQKRLTPKYTPTLEQLRPSEIISIN